MSVAVVMQVRAGSSRLPGKMCLPFVDGRTIPEVIIGEMLRAFGADQLTIATGCGPADDVFEQLAERTGVRCHRGDELDVLGRIVDAVSEHPASWVLRVCGDNPFLRAEALQALVERISDGVDYVSFRLHDRTPALLSHVGLYAEVVRRSVLDQLARDCTDPIHREHATLYVLQHPDRFRCRWLPAHPRLVELPDLRLTVDTASDFRTCRRLYRSVVTNHGEAFDIDALLDVVEAHPDQLASMRDEIMANAKR